MKAASQPAIMRRYAVEHPITIKRRGGSIAAATGAQFTGSGGGDPSAPGCACGPDRRTDSSALSNDLSDPSRLAGDPDPDYLVWFDPVIARGDMAFRLCADLEARRTAVFHSNDFQFRNLVDQRCVAGAIFLPAGSASGRRSLFTVGDAMAGGNERHLHHLWFRVCQPIGVAQRTCSSRGFRR